MEKKIEGNKKMKYSLSEVQLSKLLLDTFRHGINVEAGNTNKNFEQWEKEKLAELSTPNKDKEGSGTVERAWHWWQELNYSEAKELVKKYRMKLPMTDEKVLFMFNSEGIDVASDSKPDEALLVTPLSEVGNSVEHLIEAYDTYVSFLENECSKLTQFAGIHGYSITTQEFERGEKLRDNIGCLKILLLVEHKEHEQ